MPSVSYWWHSDLGSVRELHIGEIRKQVYLFLGWVQIKKEAYDRIKNAQDKIYKKNNKF